jgi:hypothetical protein
MPTLPASSWLILSDPAPDRETRGSFAFFTSATSYSRGALLLDRKYRPKDPIGNDETQGVPAHRII